MVASCDQPRGTSTSFCSKITAPFSLVMEAVRRSHWTRSYARVPGGVKYRPKHSPRGSAAPSGVFRPDTGATSTTFLAMSSNASSFASARPQRWPASSGGRSPESAEHPIRDFGDKWSLQWCRSWVKPGTTIYPPSLPNQAQYVGSYMCKACGRAVHGEYGREPAEGAGRGPNKQMFANRLAHPSALRQARRLP